MATASALDNGTEGPARWSFRLFGAFELNALPGGERLVVPGKRERVLLAYLALSPNCRQQRRKLATLLWGDASDETALDNLRTCVWGLRKALGEDRGLIQTEFRRGYRFTADVHSTATVRHGLPLAARCCERTGLGDQLATLVDVFCLGRALSSNEPGEATRIILDLETAVRLLALASLGSLMQIDRSI